MKTLLTFFKSLRPSIESQRDRDDAYIAGAVDICDLERRLREIDERGRRNWSPIASGLYAS